MQIHTRIAAIEKRAAAINLTVAELCRLTDVHLSTIQRWKADEVDPKLKSVERNLGKIEAELDRQEARILSELTSRGDGELRPAAA